MKKLGKAAAALLLAVLMALALPLGALAEAPRQNAMNEEVTATEGEYPNESAAQEADPAPAATQTDAQTEAEAEPAIDESAYDLVLSVDNFDDYKAALATTAQAGQKTLVKVTKNFYHTETIYVKSGIDVTIAGEGGNRKIYGAATFTGVYYNSSGSTTKITLADISIEGNKTIPGSNTTLAHQEIFYLYGSLTLESGAHLANHRGTVIRAFGEGLFGQPGTVTLKEGSSVHDNGHTVVNSYHRAISLGSNVTLNIEGAEIYNNTAGAVIASNSGDHRPDIRFKSGNVRNNSYPESANDAYGAAFVLWGADLYMTGGAIYGNTAPKTRNGGIYLHPASGDVANAHITGGSISNNGEDDIVIDWYGTGTSAVNNVYVGGSAVIGQEDAATGLATGGISNVYTAHTNILVESALSDSALVVLRDLATFGKGIDSALPVAGGAFSIEEGNHTITLQDAEAFRMNWLPGWKLEPNSDGSQLVLSEGLQQRIEDAATGLGSYGTRESPVVVTLPAGTLVTGLETIAIGGAGKSPQHIKLVGEGTAANPTVLLRAPGYDTFDGTLFSVYPGSTLVLENLVVDGNKTGGHELPIGPLVEVGRTGDATLPDRPENNYYQHYAHLYITGNTKLRNNINHNKGVNPGGALFVSMEGYVEMDSGEISGNMSARHPGYDGATNEEYAGGAAHVRGVMVMKGGTVTGNTNSYGNSGTIPLRGTAMILNSGDLLLQGKVQIGTADSDNSLYITSPSSILAAVNVHLFGTGLSTGSRVNLHIEVPTTLMQYAACKRETHEFIWLEDREPNVTLRDSEASCFYNPYNQRVGEVFKYDTMIVGVHDYFVGFSPDYEPPVAPKKPTISGMAGNGSARLTITPATSDAKTVTEYRLYRLAEDGVNYVLEGSSGNSPSFTVTGLDNGTEYTFAGTVVTRGGESEKSEPVKVTPAMVYDDATGVQLGVWQDGAPLEGGTLEKGQTAVTAANVLPLTAEQVVTWSSSRPGVVAVTGESATECVLTALDVGTATITAVSSDGKAAGSVTITVPDDRVSGATLDLEVSTLRVENGGALVIDVYMNRTVTSIEDLTFSLIDPATGDVLVPDEQFDWEGTVGDSIASGYNDFFGDTVVDTTYGYADFYDRLYAVYGVLAPGTARLVMDFRYWTEENLGRYLLRVGYSDTVTPVWDEMALTVVKQMNASTEPGDYAPVHINKSAVPFQTFRNSEYKAWVTLLPDLDDARDAPSLVGGATARFIDERLDGLFELVVLDDTQIGVKAKTDAVLKGSYSGYIELTTEYRNAVTIEVPEKLTLKIDNAKPKITAQSISVNTFLDSSVTERTRTVNLGRDDVLAVRESSKKSNSLNWVKLHEGAAMVNGQSVTVLEGIEVLPGTPPAYKDAKRSGKVYLEVLLDGWGVDANPANGANWLPVTVSVSRSYTQPGLKLSKTSLSYHGGANTTGVTLALKPKSGKDSLAGLGVESLQVAADSQLKMFEVVSNYVSPATGEFVLRATGTVQSGTLTLAAGIKDVENPVLLTLTIKASKPGARLTLKPSAKTVTLNPNIYGGDTQIITLNPSIPGFDLSGYDVKMSLKGADSNAPGFTYSLLGGNKLQFKMPQDGRLSASSYRLTVTYEGVNTGKKSDVATTVTVKALKIDDKYKPTATLSVKTGLNLAGTAPAVVALRFKNYTGSLSGSPAFRMTLKGDDGAATDGGAYIDRLTVTPLGANSYALRLADRESLPAGTYRLEMGDSFINAQDEVACNAVNFKVAASKPKVSLSVKKVTLAGSDSLSRAYFEITTPSGVPDITAAAIKTKKEGANPFIIEHVGGNTYCISFKNNTQLRQAARKSTTLTLNLYIAACETPVATAKLTVLKV